LPCYLTTAHFLVDKTTATAPSKTKNITDDQCSTAVAAGSLIFLENNGSNRRDLQLQRYFPLSPLASTDERWVSIVVDLGTDIERPKVAGKRPLAGHDLSDFGLLGHLERVIYLNPEVTHCTFQPMA